MQCPKCRHENREGARFCRQCGTELPSLEACLTGLICPKCQHSNEAGAQFCDECGTKLVEATGEHRGTVPTQIEVAVPPKLEDMQDRLSIPEPLRQRMDAAEREMEGENRLVTALFADISGFTPMSQELTPETVVERVNQCFQVIIEAVYRYEGNVNRFMGDCVLAFFGAPLAHENDPERAILAALDIMEAVSEVGLNISIGINTGMTYFGPVGTHQHQEISAYGHDINLAERLQEAADPGQILAGTGTYRLTRRIFNFDPLGAIMFKGIRSPVPAYEVLSVKERPEKLRGIEGLWARMIDRDHEFAELKEAVDRWLRGQGQIVSIIGEAGIGKSRSAAELRKYLDTRLKIQDSAHEADVPGAVSILEGRCVSIGQPISYWPFRDILRTYFGLSEEDDGSTIAGKITRATASLFGDRAEEVLPFLGHLFSVHFGSDLDKRLKFATPEQIRHQTLMWLRDFFKTLASKQPLLLILEDLHWSDDLSLDLISLLMDELASMPLMLLCVYRPERDHRCWQLSNLAQRKCLERYTEILLKPLSGQESGELVEELLAIEELPGSVKSMILQKSEGNPFFIEEIIRSLIERELFYHKADRWEVRSEFADIDVPDTIQSILLARVDRLQAEAKYVLQCASVIGRLFSYRLLKHLTYPGWKPVPQLDRYLTELEKRELVYEERTVPELEYAFRHALTQEATYQSILEKRRREIHNHVAQGIEILYWGRLEEYYEELAYHYSSSDNHSKAVEYLLKAGEKAKMSYANEAAISYFQKAIEMQKMHEEDIRAGSLSHSILIVDDEESNLSALERTFRDDYNVFSATNGKDALSIMERNDVALIIADHRIPGITGVEFLEIVSRKYPDTIRMLLTAYTDEELLIDAINKGRVHGYVTKPWEPEGIKTVVRERLDDILRVQKAEEKMVIKRNDWKLQALRGLGEVYYGIGKTVEAEEAFEEAIELAKEMELPPRQLVRLYHWIAETLWWQSRYDEVIRYGDMGLEILGNDTECLEAALMNSRIAVGNSSKDEEKWREYTHKNMAFIKKLPYSVELRLPYSHIVDVVAFKDRDLEAALEWTGELEIRAKQHNDLRGMAEAWLHKGDILASKGNYENSLPLLQKSLETYERIGDVRLTSWCYGYIGTILFESGKIEEAEAYIQSSLSMIEQVGNPRDIARSHEQSGAVAMCQCRWDEAISHFQEFLEGYQSIGDPFWIALAHLCLGIVHLRKGDYHKALQTLEQAADVAVETQQASWFFSVLGGLEEAYTALGTPEEFVEFCRSFRERHADALKELPLSQWYLEPAEPSKEFSHLVFADDFDTETLSSDWQWIDEFGDCAYRIVEQTDISPGGLEIHAANARDLYWLNLSAPRFMREVSGDFAVEVRISPASDEKPQMGGLLVWKDGDNFLRFEKGVHGKHEVRLRWPVVGRGLLPVGENEEVYLRLERSGEQVSAYCSVDGESWLTCGKLVFAMTDPLQIGIYATGAIDRIIHCGSFKDGTATLFRGFKLWTR